MAVSRIGGAAAAATSVTTPTGLAGDLLVAYAFRSSAATIPTLPAGWIAPPGQSGNTCAGIVGIKWDTTTGGATSGVFTGATDVIVLRYRGVFGVGFVASSNATGTSISYPTGTLIQTGGMSWVVGLAGHRTATNVGSVAPSGMTAISLSGTVPNIIGAYDTNAAVSSWAGGTATVNASSGHESFTLELLGANTTLNPYDKNASITLSSGNLTGTATASAGSMNVRSTSLKSVAGKYIIGYTPTVIGGSGFGVGSGVGLANASQGLAADMGADFNSFIFYKFSGSGNFVINNTNTSFVNGIFTANTANFMAVDTSAQLAWIYDGITGLWNDSITAHPDTGVGGMSFSGMTGPYYVALDFQNSAEAAVFNPAPTSIPSDASTFALWDSTGGTTTNQACLASSSSVALLQRSTLHKSLSNSAAVASLLRQTAKGLIATGSSLALLQRATARSILSSSSSVALLAAGKVKLQSALAISASVALLTRQTGKKVPASSAAVALLVRQTGKVLIATGSSTALLKRSTARAFLANSATVALLGAAKVKLLGILASSSSVALLKRSTGKRASASSSSVALLTRSTGAHRLATSHTVALLATARGAITKSILVTSNSVALLSRSTGKYILAQSRVVASLFRRAATFLLGSTNASVSLTGDSGQSGADLAGSRGVDTLSGDAGTSSTDLSGNRGSTNLSGDAF